MLSLWNAMDDRFFDDFWRTAKQGQQTAQFDPPVDVVEHETAFELRVELAGVKPEEVDVTMDGNTLTIQGERRYVDEDRKKDGYYRLERRYGKFRRTFMLPETVDGGTISAEFVNGVLTVRLPKQELAKPRKIAISGSSLTDKAKKLFSKPAEASESS